MARGEILLFAASNRAFNRENVGRVGDNLSISDSRNGPVLTNRRQYGASTEPVPSEQTGESSTAWKTLGSVENATRSHARRRVGSEAEGRVNLFETWSSSSAFGSRFFALRAYTSNSNDCRSVGARRSERMSARRGTPASLSIRFMIRLLLARSEVEGPAGELAIRLGPWAVGH